MEAFMNRNKVRLLREALFTALRPFGLEQKISVSLGNASFSSSSVEFKVNLNEVAADGLVLSREAVAFQEQAPRYGLMSSDLGQTFHSRGKSFRITGLNTRAKRYPINAEDISTGKRFKFASETVVRSLAVVV
jgi:hypothetical protein